MVGPSIHAKTVARFGYLALVGLTALVIGASCVGLLSQAVRTSPNRVWARNVNVVVIGGTYILIFLFSVAFCLKRRVSVRYRLSRIPKSRIAVGKGDLPKPVQEFIEHEFLRASAIAYESQPKLQFREGWGTPGSKNEGIRFRTALLETVPDIDAAARLVIPSMPAFRPNVPLARHLRYIKSLISADENGDIYFSTYTSIVQFARYAMREPTEADYERGMEAAYGIKRILLHYRMVQMDGSNDEIKLLAVPSRRLLRAKAYFQEMGRDHMVRPWPTELFLGAAPTKL